MIFIFFIFSYSDFIKETHGDYDFTLKAGQYEISCYGAQGGGSYNDGVREKNGGKGAYVSGILTITGTEIKFYAHVGGKGSESKGDINYGGHNGGGRSGDDKNELDKDDASGGGGGATDLRIYDDNFNSRIMVAAGGSGAVCYCQGAPGGDLNGYHFTKDNIYQPSGDVDQTNGRQDGTGGTGGDVTVIGNPGSGGGGGWRGGTSPNDYSGQTNTGWKAVSKSGSSYISGYNGCVTTKDVVFDKPQMTIGWKDGDGKINVTTLFECSSNCHSCKSATECIKCFSGYFLEDKKCSKTCSSGKIGIDGICVPCELPCLTCTTKTTTCNSCIPHFNLHNGNCVLQCPDRFFADSGICKACNSNLCDKCTKTATTCLSCRDKKLLYENKCHASCPAGTIVSGSMCEKCHGHCETCSGTVRDCLTCESGYFLHEKRCVSSCPDGTVGLEKRCVGCTGSCKTCMEKTDQCTTCSAGSYLHKGKCYTSCPTGTTPSGAVCI